MEATLIKRRILPVLLLTFVSFFGFSQQHSAGVNIDSPNPNAVLHLVSPFNDQGLLVPKLTSAQRTTLGTTLAAKNDAAADNGIMVYDQDEDNFYFWVTGVGWVKMAVDQTLANVLANGADANGVVITGAGDPTNPQDVATKNYVDTQAGVTVDGTTINGDGVITPLSVNIGTNPGDILQLGAGSQLPAVDGSLLTGITAAIGANSVNSSSITDGSIVNADVNVAAAIAGTKINPSFGAQNIVTTGNITGTNLAGDGSAITNISAVNFSGALAGDVSGTQGATVVDNVGGSTAANINTATTTVIGATSLDLDDTDDLTTADVGTGVGQVLQFGVAATLPALDGSALTGITTTNFSGALAGDVSGTQ
ncbi:MAG: hypothetical protein ABJP45_14445, partial [Cyclobacteriaceae bacterium]